MKEELKMNAYIICGRKVQSAENRVRCHLWGGFASFHWGRSREYLRAESEQQVESVVWKASGNASAHQREAEEGVSPSGIRLNFGPDLLLNESVRLV